MPSPQVPPPREAAEAALEGDLDPTMCQFCLRQDAQNDEGVLDVHYWRECPMLMLCELCEQVIEIATLHQHLQEECESGEAARAKAASIPPGRCGLCSADVGCVATDEDWRQHLLVAGCPENPRDSFRRFYPRAGRG